MAKVFLYAVLLIIAPSGFTQDIHFSQFYASPLTLNPALTGNFDGLLRLGANYRNQWASVTIPYQTFSAYTDVNMLRAKLRGNWFSMGVCAVNDHAGDGNLTVNKASLSAAYHIRLTKWRKLYLSVGLSGIYVHKKIDYSRLLFDSQWNDVGFSSQIDPGEQFISSSVSYPDLHAGISMTYQIPRILTLEGGVSMIHITSPRESLLDGTNRVHRRPVAHAYADIAVKKSLSLQPGAVYMYQRKAQEIIFGTNLSIVKKLTYSRKFYLITGIWYRHKDAIFPLLGGQLQQTRLLLTYDTNLSKLVPGSHTIGAFEISIVHIIDKKQPVNTVRYCPRIF